MRKLCLLVLLLFFSSEAVSWSSEFTVRVVVQFYYGGINGWSGSGPAVGFTCVEGCFPDSVCQIRGRFPDPNNTGRFYTPSDWSSEQLFDAARFTADTLIWTTTIVDHGIVSVDFVGCERVNYSPISVVYDVTVRCDSSSSNCCEACCVCRCTGADSASHGSCDGTDGPGGCSCHSADLCECGACCYCKCTCGQWHVLGLEGCYITCHHACPGVDEFHTHVGASHCECHHPDEEEEEEEGCDCEDGECCEHHDKIVEELDKIVEELEKIRRGLEETATASDPGGLQVSGQFSNPGGISSGIGFGVAVPGVVSDSVPGEFSDPEEFFGDSFAEGFEGLKAKFYEKVPTLSFTYSDRRGT